MPRVGILCAACDADVSSATLLPGSLNKAFVDGLRDLGYVEGQNVAFEWRGAAGREDRLPMMAAELVGLPVDLIATTGGSPAPLAAKQATDGIPIVFMGNVDPVGTGLVASFAHPGGNVTGVSGLANETAGKRLELLKGAVPATRTVDVIANSATPAFAPGWRETQAAARQGGLTVRLRDARDEQQIRDAFSAMAADRPDALLVVLDPVIARIPMSTLIVQLAAAHKLPAMYDGRLPGNEGGLMSYASDSRETFRSGAEYVDRILKGARPDDMPVRHPTKFDFIINLGAAQALDLTIPPSVLQQATEVIQ